MAQSACDQSAFAGDVGQVPMHAFISTNWKPWPDHEDFCLQFTRLVHALEDAGGTIAECLMALGRIAPGNGEDWYREWKIQAEASEIRADVAFAHGYCQTAESTWLQAAAYYRAAGVFLAVDDERNRNLLAAVEKCSHLFMGCIKPSGEIVDMRCEHNRSIRGYFLRAPNTLRRSSAVICFGGPGETKDELLGKMPRFAFARSLSLMIVDIPGISEGKAGGLPCCSIEVTVGRCVDYLLDRGDVDENRIALFGNNFGATHASRIAIMDHRFAAVVCDGGMWEENGRPLLSSWAFGGSVDSSIYTGTRKTPRYRTARRLKCPFLVTSAEFEFFDETDAARLYEYSVKSGMKMDLKLFSVDDAGPPRRGFIFDWLASKIAVDISANGADDALSSSERRSSSNGTRRKSSRSAARKTSVRPNSGSSSVG
jgi:hypothetical protein